MFFVSKVQLSPLDEILNCSESVLVVRQGGYYIRCSRKVAKTKQIFLIIDTRLCVCLSIRLFECQTPQAWILKWGGLEKFFSIEIVL